MYTSYFRANDASPGIVAYARGDVNGDRIIDNIYLTGIMTSDSPFVQDITLVIQDGMTGGFTSIPLKENTGYSPTIVLRDFTEDGVSDILIGINTGGSGGIMYYYIYSFINNTPKLLFNFDVYNQQYEYQVNYKDNYKVEVISEENNKMYIIDISDKGEEYLNEIYDKDGKLKEPIEGFVNPLSGLYPVDFDSDGVYELLAYQKIAGRYNADSLGYILNTLRWKDNMFVLDNQYLAIFGSDIQ
ncbi:VCBS repeat-containing protein [Clostridium algidicarnis]|uniref:VCBS repeat-containing protein n=1 Tax=Clostridium algidicarnis TaxID=37659 RepID=UPI001C0D0B7E|nr:VCBS repeat-containing protein [Clostridium algidicarnis]MBU3209438.1 VCBS repeat-containing protein [Clostridium algidicarnis]MBU3227307.1 VCBS repeat-containing protein [Clostridium algidicarnis]MBU3250830.1 VCBS repeat-containing protein [Clostridium algidicarnis]